MYDLPSRSDIGRCVIDRSVGAGAGSTRTLVGRATEAGPPERAQWPRPRAAERSQASRCLHSLQGTNLGTWLGNEPGRRIGVARPPPEPRAHTGGRAPPRPRARDGCGASSHLMGDPQNKQPAVHMTGTNGKRPRPGPCHSCSFQRADGRDFHQPSPGKDKRAHHGRARAPISDEDLAEVLSDLAAPRAAAGRGAGGRPGSSYDGGRFRVFRQPSRGRRRSRSRYGRALGRHQHR